MLSEYFPGAQAVHVEDDKAPGTAEYVPNSHGTHLLLGIPYAFQRAVKPLRVTDPSDVKVILRNPVEYWDRLAELFKNPDCLQIC